MTVKHQPATPLPFSALKDNHVADVNGHDVAMVVGPRDRRQQQAAYIAHAANAYPNVVRRVKDAVRFIEEGAPLSAKAGLLALLRELGEDA